MDMKHVSIGKRAALCVVLLAALAVLMAVSRSIKKEFL